MKTAPTTHTNTIPRSEIYQTKQAQEIKNSDSKSLSIDSSVNISGRSQQIQQFERIMKSVEHEPIDVDKMKELMERSRSDLKIITGEDAQLSFGWIMLGKSAEGWGEKVLELTKEAVMEAGRVLSEAFKEGSENSNGRLFSIALDRHAIVTGQQSVPDWFLEERKEELNVLPDSYRQDFENDQPYHIVYAS